ncbi:hypothetical protein Tsubulata_015219 [Turnera subulata]|uniref:Protein kinase domain-containing protein n=1 Tax=Turnera subulata TaxID=218843 RepID=A0A9Q0FHA7_9ROSI|nr:hypothetical protein Tsubulata_015219 [Turnera subulata]
MGCAQGKHPLAVSSSPRGLEKLKQENGYVGKARIANHRRSTGQRYIKINPAHHHHQPPPENYSNGSSGSDDDSGGDGEETKLRDGKYSNGVVIQAGEEEMVGGWPKWLVDNVPKEGLAGLVPKSADNYVKLDKVGQGTYSNVYKARDKETGKIVALKKVRFDTSEPESIKFMAREIMILQMLDHPNVVKLEGLATSRMQFSIYLVFDFMLSDLSRIIYRPEERLTEPQVKCYMHQLLSGLQHCHDRGILHRDIKGSNLLIDKNGMLKIADFGLANHFSPKKKHPLTSRVVTLWYRAPELLLGATDYGVGIDLWSAGCLLAEMFAGRPILPGRTEVEQLHRIFKLCGTPSDDYWKKLKLSTTFRPPQTYKSRLFQAFSEFPESSLGLLTTLLALEPGNRGSASSALQDEYFQISPLACELSGLPIIPQEEEELPQPDELRKRRKSRGKRRSLTYRERRTKGTVAEKAEQDPADSKEVIVNLLMKQENGEIKAQNQEPGGSSATSSSSGIKMFKQEPVHPCGSPPSLPTPIATAKTMMSPKFHGHPQSMKNVENLPPLPSRNSTTKSNNHPNENMYRLNRVHRSASTREFRKFDQGKVEVCTVDL